MGATTGRGKRPSTIAMVSITAMGCSDSEWTYRPRTPITAIDSGFVDVRTREDHPVLSDAVVADTSRTDASMDAVAVDANLIELPCASGLQRCAGTCVDAQRDDANCGACGRTCASGQACSMGSCLITATPRPIAPLSSATATTRRPRFRWVLPPGLDGARIEWCRDRMCSMSIAADDVTGSSATPASDLPTGVVFWRLRGRLGTGVSSAPGPTWEVSIGARSAPVDTSSGTVLDLNGDGYADVVVGALNASPDGRTAAGTASVHLGGPSGIGASPDRVLEGAAAQDRLGARVASAGDVNGDGYADLVVGAETASPGGMDSAGAVSLFLGGPSGIGATPDQVLSGQAPGDHFGYSAASAGDVNGDGYADLVVGAFRASPGGRLSAGTASVYLGGRSGVSATPSQVFEGMTAGDNFGARVASAGDVNGDGLGDFVVGATNAAAGGRTSAGTATVYLGALSGGATPSFVLEGAAPNNYFGSVGSAADVNGDGYSDVLVGATQAATAGTASIFHGGPTGVAVTPTLVLTGVMSGDSFGVSLANAGDVNRDGYADIIVGSHASLGARSMVGTASIFLGGPSGVGSTPAQRLDGAAMDNHFGQSVEGAGDVNGDGYADVIVGAWVADPGGRENAGTSSVFLGSASGIASTPARVLEGVAPNDGFGYCVAARRSRVPLGLFGDARPTRRRRLPS